MHAGVLYESLTQGEPLLLPVYMQLARLPQLFARGGGPLTVRPHLAALAADLALAAAAVPGGAAPVPRDQLFMAAFVRNVAPQCERALSVAAGDDADSQAALRLLRSSQSTGAGAAVTTVAAAAAAPTADEATVASSLAAVPPSLRASGCDCAGRAGGAAERACCGCG